MWLTNVLYIFCSGAVTRSPCPLQDTHAEHQRHHRQHPLWDVPRPQVKRIQRPFHSGAQSQRSAHGAARRPAEQWGGRPAWSPVPRDVDTPVCGRRTRTYRLFTWSRTTRTHFLKSDCITTTLSGSGHRTQGKRFILRFLFVFKSLSQSSRQNGKKIHNTNDSTFRAASPCTTGAEGWVQNMTTIVSFSSCVYS